MRKNTGSTCSEEEQFEALKRVIILLLYTFFEKKNPTGETHYCLKDFVGKRF